MNEQELLNGLLNKDESAFRALVDLHGKRVFNIVLGFLPNAEDAEDITQEVFVQIYQSIHTFHGEAALSTWIYRISTTKALEHIRNQKRKKRFAFVQSLFTDEGIHPQADKGHFNHPGVLLENKEKAALLFKAMEKLPEKQRTAFVLHNVEHLSYAEISAVMQVSIGSVESLIFRARQNLRKTLSSYYEKNKT